MFNLNVLIVMSEKVIIELEGSCGDFVTLNFDSISNSMINKTLSIYGIVLTSEELEDYEY